MRALRFALAAAVALAPASASATIWHFVSSLDGLQETPPNASTATGTASVTFDDTTNVLSWTISFSGLTTGINNAHFHGPAAIGVGPAPALVNIGFTAGMTSDTLIGSAVINATVEGHLFNELLYINLHSTTFPGGEIRGQVLPEPASVALLALGAGGVALARRRSR